jgi:hypothetical protein
MNFEQLVPNVYYVNITNGLKMFADCLGFVIGHNEIKSDQPFWVLNKDGLSIYLFEHAKLAKEHNPEFRLVTKNIFVLPGSPFITIRRCLTGVSSFRGLSLPQSDPVSPGFGPSQPRCISLYNNR